MNTELIILNTGSAYYNNVDLYEDVDISLTLQINDVRDPGKVKGTYSNSFKVPGTKNNNELFQHLFDINSDNTFDPRKKVNAEVRVNSIPLFPNGYIQLTNIDRNKQNVEYELVFYGVNTNIFNELRNLKLEELDVSELNHTLIETNISSSWSGFGTTHYYTYPLIDYGQGDMTNYKNRLRYQFNKVNGCTGRTEGNTSISPYGSDQDQNKGYWCDDMFPAISVKYLVDKIFADYGYTYSSSFLNSDIFKSLIIPFTKDETELYQWLTIYSASLTTPVFSERRQSFTYDILGGTYEPWLMSNQGNIVANNKYVYNVLYTNTTTYNGWNRLLWNSENNDYFNCGDLATYLVSNNAGAPGISYPSGNNKAAPGVYHIQQPGQYVVKFRVNVNNFSTAHPSQKFFCSPYYLNKGTWTRSSTGVASTPTYHDMILMLESDGCDVPMLISASNASYTDKLIEISADGEYNFTSSIVDFEGGELLYIKQGFGNVVPGGAATLDYTCDVQIEKYGYHASASIDMSKVLPKDVKCSDFLMSLTKQFNLYWEKVDENTYNIEPRDTYLDAGEVKDWTYKVDLSQPFIIRPLNEESATQYNWKIQKDKEIHLAKNFEITYDRDKAYGSKQNLLDIDFYATDVIDIDSIFSEAPLSQWSYAQNNTTGMTISEPSVGGLAYSYVGNDFQTTHLYLGDGVNKTVPEMVNSYDFGVNYRNTKHGTKMLFYRSLPIKAGTVIGSFLSGYSYVPTTFKLDGNTYSCYPYCGHIYYPHNSGSSLQATNLDLNFNTGKWYYNVPSSINGINILPGTYTNRNCYNVYWSRWYDEVTDKNSRIVECYLKLDPQDISNFKFNNIIFIDGTYYQVQSIEYKPKLNELAKATLLKLQFHNINYTDTIDSTTFFTNELPELDDTDENITLRVSGLNNIIEPSSSYIDIFGQTNKVLDTSTYVQTFGTTNTVQNSNKVVIENSTGSYVFNSENVSISNGYSNFVYGQDINVIGSNNLVIGKDIDIQGDNNFIGEMVYNAEGLYPSSSGNYIQLSSTNNTSSFTAGDTFVLRANPLLLLTVSRSVYDESGSGQTWVYPNEELPDAYNYYRTFYLANITTTDLDSNTCAGELTIINDNTILSGKGHTLVNCTSPATAGTSGEPITYFSAGYNYANILSYDSASQAMAIGASAFDRSFAKSSLALNANSVPLNASEVIWEEKKQAKDVPGAFWSIVNLKNVVRKSSTNSGSYLYAGQVTDENHIIIEKNSAYAIEFNCVGYQGASDKSFSFNGGYLHVITDGTAAWIHTDDSGTSVKDYVIYPNTLGHSSFLNNIKLHLDVNEFGKLKMFVSNSVNEDLYVACNVRITGVQYQ